MKQQKTIIDFVQSQKHSELCAFITICNNLIFNNKKTDSK